MDQMEILTEALALEQLEVNLFRGQNSKDSGPRIFGGQVIAQSLLAAYATVEDRVCHSLHCYFIRPGDPKVPIVFEVDRARDGGSFTTRRVIAIQHGRQIFNLAASFQVPEDGFVHQSTMPDAPDPESVRPESEVWKEAMEGLPEHLTTWMKRPRPIDLRPVDGGFFFKGKNPPPKDPENQIWFRSVQPIGDDIKMQQAILAYASDMSLLSVSMRPHGVHWQTKGFQSASLDHAMWFHEPTNFNDWHLYDQDSPSASGGRGFIRGSIYNRDGKLVASVAQEALIRLRKD